MGKTEENIKSAFAGESQARNKYTYFAEVAKQEGYHYIAKVFEEMRCIQPLLKKLKKKGIKKPPSYSR